MDSGSITGSDLRKQLTAVRDELAARFGPDLRADAVAPVGRLLVDVLVKLDELPDDAKGSKTDDLSKRRATRRASVKRDEATGS